MENEDFHLLLVSVGEFHLLHIQYVDEKLEGPEFAELGIVVLEVLFVLLVGLQYLVVQSRLTRQGLLCKFLGLLEVIELLEGLCLARVVESLFDTRPEACYPLRFLLLALDVNELNDLFATQTAVA